VDFNEAKLRQLDAATTYRVYGQEIEFDGGATARRGWRLVRPCFCLHDSPLAPCHCSTDESRWWLRSEAVIDEGNASRKDHDGQELRFFDVLVDSKIMVESLKPVSAGTLKRLGATVSPDELRDLLSGSGSGGGVIASVSIDTLDSSITTVDGDGLSPELFGKLFRLLLDELKRRQDEQRRHDDERRQPHRPS
jgi:hypothetical protein